MKNGVAIHSEDVVDSADPQPLTEEVKFCLRALDFVARVQVWLG